MSNNIIHFPQSFSIGKMKIFPHWSRWGDGQNVDISENEAIGEVAVPEGDTVILRLYNDYIGYLPDLFETNKLAINKGIFDKLDLSETCIGEQESNVLAQYKGIKRLNLANTNITDVGLKNIARINSVNNLDLSNTSLSTVQKTDL